MSFCLLIPPSAQVPRFAQTEEEKYQFPLCSSFLQLLLYTYFYRKKRQKICEQPDLPVENSSNPCNLDKNDAESLRKAGLLMS